MTLLVPAAGVLVKARAAAGARGSDDGPRRLRPWEAEAPRPRQQRGRSRRHPGGITASEGAGQRKTNGARHRFHAGPISESETDAQTQERLAVAKEDGGPGRGAAGVRA